MSERSKLISKLGKQRSTRESYIRSKLSVLLPSQIRSLRQRRQMTQSELGAASEMKQARVSTLERIGEASFSIETLIRLASAFRVGLIVKFAPLSEMLDWENEFSPDTFDAVPLEDDRSFLDPGGHSIPTSNALSPGLAMALSGNLSKQTQQGLSSPTTGFAPGSVQEVMYSTVDDFPQNSLIYQQHERNPHPNRGGAADNEMHQRGTAA